MLRGVLLLVLVGVWHGAEARSSGAPVDTAGLCASMAPDPSAHSAGPSTATFPYEVTFTASCFKAGSQVSGEWVGNPASSLVVASSGSRTQFKDSKFEEGMARKIRRQNMRRNWMFAGSTRCKV